MTEKKSPKPRSTKRESARGPTRGNARSKGEAPRITAGAAKSGRGWKATRAPAKPLSKSQAKPREAAAPRKDAPARRRGLPKPGLAEAVPPEQRGARLAEAVPSPDVGTDSVGGRVEVVLTEEEQIESSKYDLRERPRRVFEEERFLFPETYEADRVRLLVKDPEWLFAHWDVSPSSLQRLRDDVGERAMALARLTLKVEDPADAALSIVLLPEGARSWYVRTQLEHRAYRAQLGLTMPSGEFRPLATSNVVVAPRVGPSPVRASRRVAFSRAHEAAPAGQRAEAAPASRESGGPVAGAEAPAVTYIEGRAGRPEPESSLPDRGGASETFGPGGASDSFRR